MSRMWRKGICTTTVDGWQGDCERGLLGTWPVARGTAVHDANSCVERCRSCLRCQFVSFSRQNRDCSWFHACPWSSLRLDVQGADTYRTRRVNTRPVSRLAPASCGLPHAPPSAAASRPGGGFAHATHFITFHSEGPPHDQGLSLATAEALLRVAVGPYVDSYVAYTPRMVLGLTVHGIPGNATVASSNVTASNNIGLAGIGLMSVKPFVILHRLLALPRGDMLIYSDVNVLKHPVISAGIQP